MLCNDGIITREQLDQALKYQKQRGGRIGAALLDLGIISTKSLLVALKEFYAGHVVDISSLDLPSDVLEILTPEMMSQYEVMPIGVNAKSVFLAMSDPENMKAIEELAFYLGRSIQPIGAPSSQIKSAIKIIEENRGKTGWTLKGELLQKQRKSNVQGNKYPSWLELCHKLVEEKASDLLLTVGAQHSLKIGGRLKRLNYPVLTEQVMLEYARDLLSASQMEEFERCNEMDFTRTFPEIGRFRVNTFRQRNSVSIAIRTIVEDIPTIGSLNLPMFLGDFALKPHGLILISGPTGHGKTTTLAALIDLINTNKEANIITIEEPIEYHHRHKLSNVNQREVGVDTESFKEGLKRVFRQAPDVIVVGEIRDSESAAIVIQAASTGHLVMATVHCNNTTSTIERLIDLISSQQLKQMRTLLSESLLLVFNQRLVPAKDGNGLVLCYEKLINSNRIRGLIREGKAHQIRTMFQQGGEDFQPMDVTLAQLCREGRISLDIGKNLCDNPGFFQEMVSRSHSR